MKLLDQVFKYLSYRPRSITEVTKYLRSKTSDADLINQTIDYLQTHKLVDDIAFTQWLVESRSRSRPRGVRLLKQELKSKGVNQPSFTVDEPQLASKALQKKLTLWRSLSWRDFHTKACRFLSYRGFSWETIETSVKQAYNQLHVS